MAEYRKPNVETPESEKRAHRKKRMRMTAIAAAAAVVVIGGGVGGWWWGVHDGNGTGNRNSVAEATTASGALDTTYGDSEGVATQTENGSDSDSGSGLFGGSDSDSQ